MDGTGSSGKSLPHDDRKKIMSALVEQTIVNRESPDRLFCESYIFPSEPKRTPLRNAQEFATLLNACGRWMKPHTGGLICRGDRGAAYRDAEKMLLNHRSVIRESPARTFSIQGSGRDPFFSIFTWETSILTQ